MKRTMTVAIVAAVLVLAGCPNAREGMGAAGGAVIGGLVGSKVGKGSGQMLATAVGAGLGMLVGAGIGAKLDEHARMVAGEARTQALDAGRVGQAITWDAPNAGGAGGAASGRVEVVRTGALNGQPCREYVHTVKIGGRDEQVRGTACRDAAGDWIDREG